MCKCSDIGVWRWLGATLLPNLNRCYFNPIITRIHLGDSLWLTTETRGQAEKEALTQKTNQPYSACNLQVSTHVRKGDFCHKVWWGGMSAMRLMTKTINSVIYKTRLTTYFDERIVMTSGIEEEVSFSTKERGCLDSFFSLFKHFK